MSVGTRRAIAPEVIYPDSDGKPMAENTLQFEWIVTFQGNLDALFADRPDVFVAGDLLWYPVEGKPNISVAPDTLVAFGRPKGYRGSYKQWEEGGIAPQVVVEILSPGNRFAEMLRKFQFYERYGVEEYYIYDPDHFALTGYLRQGDQLIEIPTMAGWISPRLGIRFELGAEGLELYGPDGRRFATFLELHQRGELAERQAEQARREAEQARCEAEQARQETGLAMHAAEEAQRETERLKAKLRELGMDPEA